MAAETRDVWRATARVTWPRNTWPKYIPGDTVPDAEVAAFPDVYAGKVERVSVELPAPDEGGDDVTEAELADPRSRARIGLSGGGGDATDAVRSSVIRQIVALSADDYAALAVKDPATLYVITGETATVPAAPSGPLKAAALVETFDSLNPAAWAATGTVEVSGGFLDITPAFSEDASAYAAYATTGTYDLTGSTLAVALNQLPTGGDSMNLEVWFGAAAMNNAVGFVWEAGVLYLRRFNGTAKTNVATVGFDWPTMNHLRFRHDGTTLFWETSGDGAAWTARGSVAASALTWDLAAGHVLLRAGYWDGSQTPAAVAQIAGVNS